MPQAHRIALGGSWVQPAPPNQGGQHRASPQPSAMHSAGVPFWQESAAGQQVFYDPQQMYTAVPGEWIGVLAVPGQVLPSNVLLLGASKQPARC